MATNSTEFIAYLTHLTSEHRRLREQLDQIEREWIEKDFPQFAKAMPRVIEGLERLRAELAHHFAEEESGGCLEEAISREPNLSHEANRLEHEHPILLAQVDRLIKKLKVLVRDVQSAHKAKEDFRQFAEQLQAHEDAENRILKESFGDDFE